MTDDIKAAHAAVCGVVTDSGCGCCPMPNEAYAEAVLAADGIAVISQRELAQLKRWAKVGAQVVGEGDYVWYDPQYIDVPGGWATSVAEADIMRTKLENDATTEATDGPIT